MNASTPFKEPLIAEVLMLYLHHLQTAKVHQSLKKSLDISQITDERGFLRVGPN